MIFFGPGDFSQAIGEPGNFTHPEIAKTRRMIVKTAHKYGKYAGTVSVPSLRECYQEGYDFVNCGADVITLNSCCDAIKKQYDEIIRTL